MLKGLLQGPADTTIYMITGYAFVFITMLMYLVSLFVRWRKRMRELRLLQEMKKHGD